MSDYYRFDRGRQCIYAAIDPPGDKQNGVKHLLVVEDGRTEILTSWEVVTVPDVVRLTEASVGVASWPEREEAPGA